jgi:AcrR family transcriptional regulator
MALEKARTLDLREACVREALAIIGKDGLDALSLRDVARRLGVSHQAPYKHFPSREHILAEVVERAYASFAKHIDQRSRSADPYEDLGHLGSCYLNYAKKHPLQYQLMFGMPLPDPEDHPEMMHHARHAFTVLRETIARLPDRRSPAEIELDALYAWSVVHGLASILETRAGDQHGFGTDVMRQASGHVLRRIGEALGGPKRKK